MQQGEIYKGKRKFKNGEEKVERVNSRRLID
jgi:hypothetical protein